jgi:hypothetical protein
MELVAVLLLELAAGVVGLLLLRLDQLLMVVLGGKGVVALVEVLRRRG